MHTAARRQNQADSACLVADTWKITQ